MESFFKKDFSKTISKTIIISATIIFCLMAGFKVIRAFFPPPEITKDKLVGFAQYFGYPVNFDTYIFLLIIFLPVAVLFILSVKKLIK